MKHSEFSIGLEFHCGGHRWRCTDVGTRVIVAICLEPHEIAELDVENREQRRVMTDDPSWLAGPPYAMVETVFRRERFLGLCE